MINRKSNLWKRLYAHLSRTRIIDCHSHLVTEEEYEKLDPPIGLFHPAWLHYFARDIEGLKDIKALKPSKYNNDRENWKVLKEAIDKAGNVTYFRHHWVVNKLLYNLELNERNWRKINEEIKKHHSRKWWYRYLLKELSGIDLCVRNTFMADEKSGCSPGVIVKRQWNDDYSVSSVMVSQLVSLSDSKPIKILEKETDIHIKDMKSFILAIDKFLSTIKKEGAVAIKTNHAYLRTLFHERISASCTENILSNVLRNKKTAENEIKKIQDFIFWTLCEKAGEKDLVFQIHTGMQGNWNRINDSDPKHLIEPIRTFRQTKFDLFHCGYPFSIDLGVMGKHYPNVWLNMAWMYAISIQGARRILDEWLDLVPGMKILGIGTDEPFPEIIAGHVYLARNCIADVLTKKIELDFLTEDVAFNLIEQLLRKNGIFLYGLKKNPAITKTCM